MGYLSKNAKANENVSEIIKKLQGNTKGIVKTLRSYHNSDDIEVTLQKNQIDLIKVMLHKKVSGKWLIDLIEEATIKTVSGKVTVHKTLEAIDWYCDKTANHDLTDDDKAKRLESVKKDYDTKIDKKAEKEAQKADDEAKIEKYEAKSTELEETKAKMRILEAKLEKLEAIARKFKEKKATATATANEVVKIIKA